MREHAIEKCHDLFDVKSDKSQQGVMLSEWKNLKNNKSKIVSTIAGCAYVASILAVSGFGIKADTEKPIESPVYDTEEVISEETQQGTYSYTPVYLASFKDAKTSEVQVIELTMPDSQNYVSLASLNYLSEEPVVVTTTMKTRATETKASSSSKDETQKTTRKKSTVIVNKSDEKWYIPVITLDYEWETFEMPYEHQKLLHDLCEEKNIDYWLMLATIARESRFDPNCTNGDHVGYMQLCSDAVTDMKKRLGDPDLDKWDPEDNIRLGVELFDYMLEKTKGDEYAAQWAYCEGYGGYTDQKANGKTHNVHADKAYKYRKMLVDEELNPRK